MKINEKYLMGGFFLILGIILGVSFDNFYFKKTDLAVDFHSLRLVDPEHKMISPLLLSGLSIQGDTEEFKNIENKLKLSTYDALNISGVSTISIYYKDLNSGLWAGIGENTGYDPASLLKVPIMIAWLKKEENNPGILNQTLKWGGSPNDNKNIEFFNLKPGSFYDVDYLIKMMITKSDNDAKNLLLSNLDPEDLNNVFKDLDIINWQDPAGNPRKISTAIYSRFLRVLYNSTYLNKDLSEKALELLTMSDFNEGLIAGVPSNIKVAHKFGQYTYGDQKGLVSTVELHDCGIIYHPQKPYLLCVMTQGKTDITNLESIIKNISSTIYNSVDTGN